MRNRSKMRRTRRDRRRTRTRWIRSRSGSGSSRRRRRTTRRKQLRLVPRPLRPRAVEIVPHQVDHVHQPVQRLDVNLAQAVRPDGERGGEQVPRCRQVAAQLAEEAEVCVGLRSRLGVFPVNVDAVERVFVDEGADAGCEDGAGAGRAGDGVEGWFGAASAYGDEGS